MSVAAYWMPIALRELGVMETPGPGSTSRIVSYHAACTLHATDDAVPWCSAFTGWVLAQAGLVPTHNAMARSWTHWGRAMDLLNPYGAITVLARPDGGSGSGHVGFCLDADGPDLWLLGGNQHDSVSIARFPVSRMIACRWPEELSV